MSILIIVGYILAFINPVIGGVLVGYIVWLSRPDTGFQIIVLSFFMLSLYAIAYVVWTQKKQKKLEDAVNKLKEEAIK